MRFARLILAISFISYTKAVMMPEMFSEMFRNFKRRGAIGWLDCVPPPHAPTPSFLLNELSGDCRDFMGRLVYACNWSKNRRGFVQTMRNPEKLPNW